MGIEITQEMIDALEKASRPREVRVGIGINDFLKCCVPVKHPAGNLLCWDTETDQFVVVFIKKTAVSITDLTEAEIIALKKKLGADKKEAVS
jgi:hypothetical protein